MSDQAGRVRLRPLQSEDHRRWLEWINDPAVMDALDRALPATAEQHEQYVRQNVTENRSAVWFAVEAVPAHEHVGVIWLWDINERHRRAEVRLVIAPKAAGHGYGPEALRMLARYAHRTLGLHKLYAYVHERNARSRSAFEHAGFSLEATLQGEAFWDGRFADVWRLVHFSES